MFSSIRFWLVSLFSFLILICLIASFLFFSAMSHSRDLMNYHSHLKATRIAVFEINKLKEDILLSNSGREDFFSSQTSPIENKFRNLNHFADTLIRFFNKSPITARYKMTEQIRQLTPILHNFSSGFQSLIYLYKLKGFKDFGLEGQMRNHAHRLYDLGNKEVKFYCLLMRRHEKDFLLRKDPTYVRSFYDAQKKLVKYLTSSHQLSVAEKNLLINEVYFYSKYFGHLYRIEAKLGIVGSTGLVDASRSNFEKISSIIESLDIQIETTLQLQKEQWKDDVVLFFSIFIAIILTVIIFTVQLITGSVKSITASFSEYINSSFSFNSIKHKRFRITEFNLIYKHFLKMANEINIFTNFFREKVQERTAAINKQKEEILEQQRQIEIQYSLLMARAEQLSEQRHLLARKNSDIEDSLRYAQRIQNAIQPGVQRFRRHFPDSFVFYKPRDVVSGDFYLVYQEIPNNGVPGSKITLVAADCTGHGVPGAMMSVMGINTLNKLVKEMKTTDPGTIMNLLDRNVNHVFASEIEEREVLSDGMDIAVFTFDPATYKLEYCIAKFTHFLVRKGQIITLPSNKLSIGYNFLENIDKNFSTAQFQIYPGDLLYLFTDGYGDQFGGPENKKFKRNNIKTLIEKINHLGMSEQETIFVTEFNSWKMNNPQIDDVMVIGIRF